MLTTCNTKCNFGNITKKLNVLFLISLKINPFFVYVANYFKILFYCEILTQLFYQSVTKILHSNFY